MKTKSLGNILFIFFFVLTFALAFISEAGATKPPKPQPQTQGQQQHQDQNQNQTAQGGNAEAHGGFGEGGDSYADSSSNSESYSEGGAATAASDASANNQGNSLSVNNEGSPADIVLVPQGHTANCMRTYGLSFGNREGGGGFGWPYRDKSCDFDANASAADLQGNYDLGWFWRCQKKNSYRVFRSKDETIESAIEDCVAQNSGENFQAKLIEQQKADLAQANRERDAALIIIEERDKEATRLKNEVAEKRLVEAVSK